MATLRTVTVKSSGGDYTSLSAAEAGEQGDLVTLDRELLIECYAMSDTTAVTFAGWTTDATRFVRVEAASGAGFNGAWTTSGKYVLAISSATILGINFNNATSFYSRFKGIQASHSGSASNFSITIGNDPTVTQLNEFDSCMFWNTNTTAASGRQAFDFNRSGVTVKARNCVFRCNDPTSNGVVSFFQNTFHFHNCTVDGGDSGAPGINKRSSTGTGNARNCAVFRTSDDFASAGGTFNIAFCASDDGDGTNAVNISPGGTEATDWAATFTDYVNGDYTVKDASSYIYNVGTDLSGDANYAVTVDAKGTARPQATTYDIGCDELVSGGGGGPTPVQVHSNLALLGVG